MQITLAVLAVLAGTLWALWTPDRSMAELETTYLESPADRFQVLGVNLHVRDRGPRGAPAVLFLHGFGSSLQTWEAWTADLARDMRVISFDLPGNGLSNPDPSGDYSDARTMALMLALLDQLHVDKVSLVGNSIGGRIAWTFAATHPERVAKLVLVSPDGYASPGFEYGKAPEVPGSIQLMRFTLPRWLLKMSLAPAYANPVTMTDALARRYHALMLGPGARDAMIARMQQTVLVDPVPLLKRITAPTLLLWGRQDGMIPFDNSADYARAIPHNMLVALDGVGHLPQEEDPVRSLVPVRAFLMENSPSN
jgi:pimeloyl-ACP methyl ester carboxylesterase